MYQAPSPRLRLARSCQSSSRATEYGSGAGGRRSSNGS